MFQHSTHGLAGIRPNAIMFPLKVLDISLSTNSSLMFRRFLWLDCIRKISCLFLITVTYNLSVCQAELFIPICSICAFQPKTSNFSKYVLSEIELQISWTLPTRSPFPIPTNFSYSESFFLVRYVDTWDALLPVHCRFDVRCGTDRNTRGT